MKNELEHIKKKYFSSGNNNILYAILDNMAGEFCINFDKLLSVMIDSDHPDFYAKDGNNVYLFEHFTIDASHTNRKGSLEQKEIVRIDSKVDELYSKGNNGHISDKIKGKANFENFKINIRSTYQKHVKSIPDYIETLNKKQVVNSDSEIITCFFIENTSPMGNYLLIENKLREFNLFTADFFIDLLDNTENNPDFLFYAQETKDAPILLLMCTAKLDIYKKHTIKITNNNFIAFNPHVIKKRFFIDSEKEIN